MIYSGQSKLMNGVPVVLGYVTTLLGNWLPSGMASSQKNVNLKTGNLSLALGLIILLKPSTCQLSSINN
jgi:hypothetical protein